MTGPEEKESLETTGEILLVEHEDRRWWPLAVSVGASVLSAVLAASLALTVNARDADRERQSREELQRSVCSIVVTLNDNYAENEPATEVGRANAKSMADLRIALGCPPKAPR